jgi:hypothetical protein
MIKVSANPTWEWQSSKPSGVITRTAPVTIRQTILPRSLDLDFSLKYRR